jgi:outer membrane protein insertion porin family
MAFIRKKLSLAVLTAVLVAQPLAGLAATGSFVVKNIKIEGLQGVSSQTVMSYMPIKTGQVLRDSDTAGIISALYQTGFFGDVSLSRENNTLIVHVTERPVIYDVSVSGNSLISTDQINSVLKDVGLVKGQTLDQSTLDQVKKSLESAYDSQGHYSAVVTTDVSPLSRHRVDVKIHVSEGRVALVEQIHITGNHDFSEKKLQNELTLTTPKWNSFYTHADHYTKDAFHDSLEALSDFYFDRGYLHFKIENANAVLSDDKKSVTLIIQISEGGQYKFSGYQYSGQLLLPPAAYNALPEIKALKQDGYFSRKRVVAATKAIQSLLGDKGYALANVNVIPIINESNKTVSVNFQIQPGRLYYIRRINFHGDTTTDNRVLRHAMQQSEGELYSSKKQDQSIQQLNMLGYFTGIKQHVVPVENSDNQVDLDYEVTEQPSAAATLSAGYGTDGFVVNAGVNEANFLGTGDQVGVNFSNSVYQRSYSFNFNNPYYTPEGVQRGFSLYNVKTMPDKLDLAAYQFTQYGANVIYSIPFSLNNSYQAGIGIQRTSLSQSFNPSQQIAAFVHNEGNMFNQTMLTFGWTRNRLNHPQFPDEGSYQNAVAQVSAPLAGAQLDYYKLSYKYKGYYPIGYGFIGGLTGNVGYGGHYGSTRGLPFFANYFAGGLATEGEVRGYQTGTLGPRDSQNNPIGGNALLSGSAQMILPHPLSGDTFRTSVFVDAGQVFTTWNMYNTYKKSVTGINFGDMRYSTGIDFQVKLPVFNTILEFDIAKPSHTQIGDETQYFSFNIGTSF